MPDRVLLKAHQAKKADLDHIAHCVALSLAEIELAEQQKDFLSAVYEQYKGELAIGEIQMDVVATVLDSCGLLEAEDDRAYHHTTYADELATLTIVEGQAVQMEEVIQSQGAGCLECMNYPRPSWNKQHLGLKDEAPEEPDILSKGPMLQQPPYHNQFLPQPQHAQPLDVHTHQPYTSFQTHQSYPMQLQWAQPSYLHYIQPQFPQQQSAYEPQYPQIPFVQQQDPNLSHSAQLAFSMEITQQCSDVVVACVANVQPCCPGIHRVNRFGDPTSSMISTLATTTSTSSASASAALIPTTSVPDPSFVLAELSTAKQKVMISRAQGEIFHFMFTGDVVPSSSEQNTMVAHAIHRAMQSVVSHANVAQPAAALKFVMAAMADNYIINMLFLTLMELWKYIENDDLTSIFVLGGTAIAATLHDFQGGYHEEGDGEPARWDWLVNFQQSLMAQGCAGLPPSTSNSIIFAMNEIIWTMMYLLPMIASQFSFADVLHALIPMTPTYIFPAMNTLMYKHPLMAKHLHIVCEVMQYNVISPVRKNLVCGDVGLGAMTEWRDIVKIVVDRFCLQLK
ncbi:hypothetical protein J3A83DRAFT_4188063 [Scleroderma citrinum]